MSDSLLLCSLYVSVARFTADRAVRFGRLAAHARRWLSGSWAHPRQERTADKCDRPRHAGGPERGHFWVDWHEAVPFGSVGFGRTVRGRVIRPCELGVATRPERGALFYPIGDA